MAKFYITTPIYYVNANPHIGHAYTQIAVDTLTRYHKMIGDETFYLTGTDEHGEKIEEACIKAGFAKGEEKKFVDRIVLNFKNTWRRLDIKYDYFIRTTDESHIAVVQEMLTRMKEAGDIYEGEYDGWFCTPCETFWTDKQTEGGKCPDCHRPVERIKEKNYFLRTGKYQAWLIDYINTHPSFVMPSFRKNEVLGFLREPLTDLCISRPKERMAWGIELPFDKNYVVYVWFDALINYVSAPKALKKFDTLWPADFHIIAKDILRHHAVFWPIMLKSAGLSLPKTVFAHGWWKMGEEKMSKSKGNIVDPLVLIDTYGVDVLRYFLLKTISFGMDGSFSEDALKATYNSDLANDLGNLLNRTLVMVEKYFNGISPEAPEVLSDKEQEKRSAEMRAEITALLATIHGHLTSDELRIKESIECVMQKVVSKANKYIEASAPWKYAKENNMDAIKVIIADLLEALRVTAIALSPVMTGTAGKIWSQLGYSKGIEDGTTPEELMGKDGKGGKQWRRFPAGMKIAKGEPLFPRMQ